MNAKNFFLNVLILIFATISAGAQTAAKPFPQHVAYTSGHIKPSAYTQEQLDDFTKNFYLLWKSKYVKSDCGGGQYYVDFDKGNTICVSEGLGYGMMIMPLMAGYDANAKRIFDGMYKFYKAHPSSINQHLMAWKQIDGCIDDVSAGADAASDGDIDIAYGLLLADIQWGSHHEVNYFAEAKNIIAAILKDEVNQKSRTVELGDWVSASSSFYNSTRCSDFITDHFRVFECATQNSIWDKVVDTCYSLLEQMQTKYSPTTGLIPDFIINTNTLAEPAAPNFLEDENDGDYYYNSCRVPWRIGTDYLLNGEARAKQLVNKINSWLKSYTLNNPDNITSGYKLDGTPVNTYSDAAFVGSFTVGAMVDEQHQAWLDLLFEKLMDYNINNSGYFSNTLKMLNLLVISGNYWSPDCNVLSIYENNKSESKGFSLRKADNYLVIELEKEFSNKYFQAFLYDTRGRTIKKYHINESITRISMAELPPGCYFVKLINSETNKSFMCKIVF